MTQSHSSPTRPATLVEGLEGVSAGIALVAGQRMGPYRLVKALGEGGMGVVWLADQVEPFERKVAIKLSNQKLSSGLSQAYFEVERQAMATMVHPYIAQIYDAGALPDGALYFAMEYVAGGSLDEYICNTKPSLDNCAALLALVCQGVQYAHQRGLIHRDLKPANILIADIAGKPMPKIIDFGIAIGVDSARAVGIGGSAGTRAYMAPEQLNPNTDGIDVRADIYALGAILIETLFLALNISLERLDSNSLRSLLSAAAYTTDGNSQQVQPSTALRSQIKRIPKPLRAIALKAMANDRNQRYESAAAFADDLSRWRDRRPVLAMRGGRLYAVRCFINRYRGASALGFLTLASLIAGLVVAAYGLNQAQHARALAETRREQAEELVNYMLGDFAEKLKPIGKLDLIDGVANRALQYLRQANDPDARSAIHRAAALRIIGDLQTQRGTLPQALETFALADKALADAEALGQPDAALLFERGQTAFGIGQVHYFLRNFDAARVQWQRYLDFSQRLQPLTEATGQGLLETSYALNNLGSLAFESTQLNEAKRLFGEAVLIARKALNRAPEDEALASNLANMISWQARSQEASGDLIGAMATYRDQLAFCLAISSKNEGASSWQFKAASARHWVGLIALQLGKSNDSEVEITTAVLELEKIHSLEPGQSVWKRQLATAKSNLGWIYFLQQDFGKASLKLSDALQMLASADAVQAASPDWQRSVAIAKIRLADVERAQGQLSAAQILARSAESTLEQLAVHDPQDRKSLLALATVLLSGLTSVKDAASKDYQRARALVLPLSVKQVDAEVLDLLVRANILLREYESAKLLNAKLTAMGYQHPSYRAFLALHPEGAIP